MYSYYVGENTLNIFINGIPHNFFMDTELAKDLVEAITKKASEDEILEIIESYEPKTICSEMKYDEGITITEDTILIDGEKIPEPLVNQFILHIENKLPIQPLRKFVQKLRKNPSYRIREQLWRFIEASQESGGFSLSEDGDILAYKKVRNDYKDIHSGKFDNSVGKVVEMERTMVDDDPNNTCSSGLHFCAYSYLSCFGDAFNSRIMLVKVNPKDVVSIPTDYNNAKARCCRYEVVEEVKQIITEPVYNDYENWKWDDLRLQMS